MIVGVDTGGTFTDLVLYDGTQLLSWKLPSTPGDYARAVLQGVEHLAPAADDPFTLVHSSTVATNALLERRGARTALVATEGFRDVLEIGRQDRPDLYNLQTERPAPLVPRARRFEVRERISADGEVLTPLDEAALRPLVDRLRKKKVESVAVCLLFSFLSPRHEQAVGRALRRAGFAVSLSSDILPEFREYERTSTTAINAFVSPVMTAYINRIARRANSLGAGALRIVQSNGGSLSARAAGSRAVRTLLSGPAAGVAGAVQVGRQALRPTRSDPLRLITFDMGGTSTDVSLVDGDFQVTAEGTIGGLPVHVPMIDIHTVGAGGGSLAHVDPGGLLHVGPRSAGADPGPACYGRGSLPAVTDANLVLGRIHPGLFLGGRMRLDPERAERALRPLARRLDLSVPEAARAVIRLVNANMERAIRVISVERGHDPRQFTLVSFGGAGGLHACDLAAALGMPRVLIPRHPGVLSALGCIAEDVIKDASRTVMLPHAEAAAPRLDTLFRPLRRRMQKEMAREGFAPDAIRLEPALDLRYEGQSYEVTVPYDGDPAAAEDAFHREHRRLYGHATPGLPLEWVNLRLRAVGPLDKPALPRIPRGGASPAPALLRHAGRTPLYRREALRAGNRLHGPAIVLEDFSTHWIPPPWSARVDAWGHLRIEQTE